MSGFQPTLSALNQGTKMETNDIDLDDIGALFMKNSSPNVTLGMYIKITETKSGKTGLLYLYNCQLVSRKKAKYQFF